MPLGHLPTLLTTLTQLCQAKLLFMLLGWRERTATHQMAYRRYINIFVTYLLTGHLAFSGQPGMSLRDGLWWGKVARISVCTGS